MDKTEPRNRLIAFYSVLAVATLVMLKPAFDAYYDQMFEAARADRLATYDDLSELRDTEREWRQQLEGGRLSIDDAMQQLGERGRTAVPQIAPRADAEMNLDPLRGWTHFPEGAGLPGPEPTPEAGAEPGEDGEVLQETVLEGGEAPPDAEALAGEGAPGEGEAGAAEPGAAVAPGLDPGTQAPGGAGQPGAGGSVAPPVVRRARQPASAGEGAAPQGAARERAGRRPAPAVAEPAADDGAETE